MKSPLLLLRVLVFVFLGFSTVSAVAKPCYGYISVSLKQADGTITTLLNGYFLFGVQDVAVTLAIGDTILLSQYLSNSGFCYGNSLSIHGALLGDTATNMSPIIYSSSFTGSLKFSQSGSFYVAQDWEVQGNSVRLFVDMEQVPVPVGLRLRKTCPSNYSCNPWIDVAYGDTCSNPCMTAYLSDGGYVRIQAVSGNFIQYGGNVVVRFAAEGDSVNFASPAFIYPMNGFEGYQFSEDGNYLLSVEGPTFTSLAFAHLRISHLTPPRIDMSLIIERADGTTEDMAYLQPIPNTYSLGNIAVDLGPGDSLRVTHHEITAPCSSVRLRSFISPDWVPPNGSLPFTETPSTAAGIRIANTGSYLLLHRSDCGIPTTGTFLTINAITPQLDLVCSVQHSNGIEEELFRSPASVEPPPHLETVLYPGDSIRVYYEETGWCGSSKNIQVYRSNGPWDATETDPRINWGTPNTMDFSFSDSANYLIRLYGGICYSMQNLHLRINYPLIAGIDLQLDHLQADGTTLPITYAEAGEPITYTNVTLAPNDSIHVTSIMEQALCNDVNLKIYQAATDSATALDPVYLESPLTAAGIKFREAGSLFLTLEDTCGLITASTHITVTETFSTGIITQDQTGFSARYFNDLLLVTSENGGLLQIRNIAGQLVYEVNLANGSTQHSVPFSGQAGGVYIATLIGDSRVDAFRFTVY